MGKRIEKDQFLLSGFGNQLRFHYLRGKGHLLAYAYNRFQWHNYPRWQKTACFPLHIDIEISSLCDMECPMCFARTNMFQSRVKRGLMDFGLFKKIIDESVNYGLFSIRLSLRGEAFLNPELMRMLKYAKDKGIKEVSTLTNGWKLNEAIFEQLVDNGLDWLTISIDGWGDTYEVIRKPVKFEEMYLKVKHYAQIKKLKRNPKPVIKIQSIWPAIQGDPGYFYSLFKPYVDEIASNPLIDLKREDVDVKYLTDFCCPYLWQRMSIGADGNILMCQCDDMEENILGNAMLDAIYDIWHSDKLNCIRNTHAAHKGYLQLKPCKHCAYTRSKEIKEEISIENRKIVIEKYAGRDDSIDFLGREINEGY